MVKIVTGFEQRELPDLFQQMFEARAAVFRDRLGWDVTVEEGREIDRYDRLDDTVYVLTEDEDGRLTGSLRLLPTTGDTMLHNEFADFFGEPVDFRSPTAWECTRFCVHPPREGSCRDALQPVSSELLIGLCALGLDAGMEHIVGLYDDRMTRVYRRIGWAPDVLAESVTGRGHLKLGIWEVTPKALASMRSIAAARWPITPQQRAA